MRFCGDDTHPNELCQWSSGCPLPWRSRPSDGPPVSWCYSAQRMLGSWWSSGLLKSRNCEPLQELWHKMGKKWPRNFNYDKRDQGFELFTWVNKSFYRVSVDFAIDVEHNHLSKAFWGLLHGNGHVFFHIVLPAICTNQRWRYAKPLSKYEQALLPTEN